MKKFPKTRYCFAKRSPSLKAVRKKEKNATIFVSKKISKFHKHCYWFVVG
jgi:hypothetical protein